MSYYWIVSGASLVISVNNPSAAKSCPSCQTSGQRTWGCRRDPWASLVAHCCFIIDWLFLIQVWTFSYQFGHWWCFSVAVSVLVGADFCLFSFRCGFYSTQIGQMKDGSKHWRCQKVMACGLTLNFRHEHRTWASLLLACFASLEHFEVYFRVDARACSVKMLLGKLQEIPINLLFSYDWHVLE